MNLRLSLVRRARDNHAVATSPPQVDLRGPPRLRARFGDLRLPWVPLGDFPTPVQPLEALSRSSGAECWVKRDDLSGARYGGNKVRKLELLLGSALARGQRGVVTIGAYGSHHALATARYGRAVGLDVTLVLYPQPITPHVLDDLLLDHATGARLVWTPHPTLAPLVARLHALRTPRTDIVPAGGSSALGTLGYVEGALELADQVARGELPAPDYVVVAAGTCGTVAGIALGLELAGLRARVVGVRVVPAPITNELVVRRLEHMARRLLRKAGARWSRTRTVPVEIDPHELGAGYGVETEAARDAVARFSALGLALETTYTGKAAAAFARLVASPALKGKRALFWHTFSSVDLAHDVAGIDPAALPARFHAALRAGGRLA